MNPRTMGADREVISCTYDWGIPSGCDEHAAGLREIKSDSKRKKKGPGNCLLIPY